MTGDEENAPATASPQPHFQPAPNGRPYRDGFIGAQDAIRLYYRDYPPTAGGHAGAEAAEKPAVLCLSGLTRTCRDFDAFAPWIADMGFRVVTTDYRGRGRSDYDPEWRHYQPETYVDDIRHLCCALGLSRLIAVGTSLGGGLAMGLAVAMPTTLAGAVLNDIGPRVTDASLDGMYAYMRSDPHLDTWAEAAEHIRRAFPNMPADTEEDWLTIAHVSYREDASGKLVFDWDRNILKPLERDPEPVHDLTPYFRALADRPVLVLRGALSEILEAETYEAMSGMLPNLRRVTVPGVGHAPGLGEPQAREALHDYFAAF